MSDLVVRNYKEEDLAAVLRLYDSTSSLSPFFERNADYFKHFLNYPGVDYRSIFVAEREKGIEGVEVISIVEREGVTEGRVIEVWTGELSTMDVLLKEAAHYCSSKGVDILFVAPPMHLISDKAFDEWLRLPQKAVMMAKPLLAFPLLQALLTCNMDVVKRSCAGSFVFIIGGESVRVKISQDSINIALDDDSQQNLRIELKMSLKTLVENAFGLTNPYIAWLTGRVKIKGLRYAIRALKLLQAIKIDAPWTVEFVDGM